MRWFGLGRDRERSRSRPRVASAAALAALAAHERREEHSGHQQEAAAAGRRALQGAEARPAPWPTGGPTAETSATGLGNARAGVAVYLIPPAGVVGPDGNVGPALMRAAMLAAREAGRRPDEIWEEALSAWLLAREVETAPAERPPALRGAHRQAAWGEIEATVRALRAS